MVFYFRPRKVYVFLPEKSCSTCNPEKDIMTFPNIPFWTGLNGARKLPPGFKRNIMLDVVQHTGRATPFINVTISELLFGYEDELPCLKLDKPKECNRYAIPLCGMT